MSKRAEFRTLSAENLAHVTEHQWPPVSYLKEVQKYKDVRRMFDWRKDEKGARRGYVLASLPRAANR